MIQAILEGVFSVILDLINALLMPLNALINAVVPSFSDMVGVVVNGFNAVFSYIGWAVNGTLLWSETISFIIIVITFKLTLPYTISAIKTAVKWFRSLKL